VFYSESKDSWIGRAVVGVQPNGKQKYKEVSAKTKGEVLAKMRRAATDGNAGRLGNDAVMTTGQYLQHWLDNVAKPSVEVSTWMAYERCVRVHLKPRIGGVKLLQLRPHHVESAFAELQRDGVSGGNARKVSEVLSTALEHSVRVGTLPVSPAASVPKPKAEPKAISPFTQEEILAILLAAEGNRLEALFALAIGTGARQGELLGLHWEFVDWDAGAITIERSLSPVKGGFISKVPKSAHSRRTTDLPRFCVNALHEHRKRMLAEGRDVKLGPVFLTRTGNYIEKSNLICKVYVPLLAAARVPYRKFHTFRHTHVSELLSRGVSVVDVARRIGDRPEVVLKSYAHWLPKPSRAITDRLEAMYG
jgi:integrase